MHNNTKNSEDKIPEKVLELVPWYAIGKLSVDDQAFFEKALVTYPSLQKYLDEELQIIEKVSADESLLDKSALDVTDQRLKSVLNMIDLDEARKTRTNHSNTAESNSLLDKLKNSLDSLFPSQNGQRQYARIASISALVLTVAVLSAFVAPLFTQNNDFIPASAVSQQSENNSSTQALNTVLIVGFNGNSAALANNSVLKGKLLKIETVPEKAGMFKISFKQLLSDAEVKTLIEALLAQQDLIWFAGEAF